MWHLNPLTTLPPLPVHLPDEHCDSPTRAWPCQAHYPHNAQRKTLVSPPTPTPPPPHRATTPLTPVPAARPSLGSSGLPLADTTHQAVRVMWCACACIVCCVPGAPPNKEERHTRQDNRLIQQTNNSRTVGVRQHQHVNMALWPSRDSQSCQVNRPHYPAHGMAWFWQQRVKKHQQHNV